MKQFVYLCLLTIVLASDSYEFTNKREVRTESKRQTVIDHFCEDPSIPINPSASTFSSGTFTEWWECKSYQFARPAGGFTQPLLLNFKYDYRLRLGFYRNNLDGISVSKITLEASGGTPIIIPACWLNKPSTTSWYITVTPAETTAKFNFTISYLPSKEPLRLSPSNFTVSPSFTIAPEYGYEYIEFNPSSNVSITVNMNFHSSMNMLLFHAEDCPILEGSWSTMNPGTNRYSSVITTHPNSVLTYLVYFTTNNTGTIQISRSTTVRECDRIPYTLGNCGFLDYETTKLQPWTINSTDNAISSDDWKYDALDAPSTCRNAARKFLCSLRFPKCENGTNFPMKPCASDCLSLTLSCSAYATLLDWIDPSMLSTCQAARPVEHCYSSVTPPSNRISAGFILLPEVMILMIVSALMLLL